MVSQMRQEGGFQLHQIECLYFIAFFRFDDAMILA